jgi:hypothetical protein
MTYKPYHNLLISHNRLCICNQGVTGSIPVGGTRFLNGDNGLDHCRRFYFLKLKVINSYKQILGVLGVGIDERVRRGQIVSAGYLS